jgi:hypothetical protein
MKRKILTLVFFAALAGWGTGCVNTVDDRTEFGVPFVKDSVEGRYERTAAQVLAAAKEVLAENGVLTAENTLNNSLEARINQRSVWVRVEEIEPAKPLTRVTVETRTLAGGTDLDLAHEMEKQIALRLVR